MHRNTVGGFNGAFGRMPIVIQLGDFLQKKPIGGYSISLIDDIKERERIGKLPRISLQNTRWP